jgi:hypothetical protein
VPIDIDDADTVGDYRTAYCPTCDANYGKHDDGDCPSCATALDFSPDYAALLADGYKGIVRALARKHAPDADAAYPTCAICMDGTPLGMDSASDVAKANVVDDVCDAARDAVARLGDDTFWVDSALKDAYTDAFDAACADPADCVTCHDAAVSDDHSCGHDDLGRDCPAR